MALRICSDEDAHLSHRWVEGEYEPFCPGRHAVEAGAWLADRASRRRKLSGRVHFYLGGEPRSICGYGFRMEGMLPFDPETGMTREPDPRFGQAQYRTACTHCSRAVIPPDHRDEEDRA